MLHRLTEVHEWVERWVLRLEHDVVTVDVHPFESCLVADQNGGDLSVVHGRLLADVYDITIVDAGVYHAVAFAPQREVGVNVLRDFHLVLDVLRGQNRLTAGNRTEQRDFIRFGHGHDVVGDDILVIETPPQHGKSLTITESLPSWYLGKYPTRKVILASYNDDFAERFCRRNKEKIRQFGDKLFHIQIGEIDRATEIELDNHKGRLISRGIRSGITGNPGDLIIIDDPIKSREEADSDTWRDKVWAEWQNSIKSRLSAGAKVVVIMTPWHEDDLAARILATEPNATLLRIPVEAEENDPLGRNPGSALCPELGKDDAWLADFKASYLSDPKGGARAWTALYQCSPRIEGGNLIQRSWWQYFDPKDVTVFGTELISVDATFKGLDTSDFVAITVWGKLGANYYLRYCMNRKMSFTETLQAIRLVQSLYPAARRVLIEDKANGSAIIDVLQREMFCIPVNPKGGKKSRVNAVSPAIEAGHVFLPMGAPWLDEYIEQWSAFPAGAHDDMVDSTTQALGYMLYSSGEAVSVGLPERAEEQRREEDAFLDSESLYDVYGDGYESWY